MLNGGGTRVAGGTYPARIWSAFMNEPMKGLPPLAFPAPDPELIPGSRFIGGRNARVGDSPSTRAERRRTGEEPRRRLEERERPRATLPPEDDESDEPRRRRGPRRREPDTDPDSPGFRENRPPPPFEFQ